ncbi:MAG: class A beta-lactamase-related serine hydrolase, partial [Hymenobacter sp.]
SYAQFNDSLVARFNRGDFRGVEAFGSAALKQLEPAGSLARQLASLQPQTGRITGTQVLGGRGRSHEFDWQGEKQHLRVVLVSSAPGVLDDYFISDFVAQPRAQAAPLPTDNPGRSALDQAVQRAATLYFQHPGAVGLSLAVAWRGRQYFYNYGAVARGGALPTAATYYNPGSIAKTFVTTLLAQAVADHKVQLTDDIRRYLPGAYPNLEYQGRPVRLVDLANHTSGLPTSAPIYPKALGDSLRHLDVASQVAYYNHYSADSLLRDAHRWQLGTQPGTTYRYNGNAMKLLQLIMERVYQQPYEQLLARYYGAAPYRLAGTKRVLTAAEQARFATGYADNGQPVLFPTYTGYWGGPNLNSTPADLLRYARVQLAERAPAVRLAHQRTWGAAPGFGLGLGWMLNTDADGDRLVYHNGHAPGFNARCVLYPGQDLALVLLVNDNISQSRLDDFTRLLKQELPQAAVAAGPAK